MEIPITFLNDFKPTCPHLVHWLGAHHFVQSSIMSPAYLQLHHRLRRVARRPALGNPDHSNKRALFQLIEARESPPIVDPIPRVWDPGPTSMARHFSPMRDGADSKSPADKWFEPTLSFMQCILFSEHGFRRYLALYIPLPSILFLLRYAVQVVLSSFGPRARAGPPSVYRVAIGAHRNKMPVLVQTLLTNSVSLRSSSDCPCCPLPVFPFCNSAGRLPSLWQSSHGVVSSTFSLSRRHAGGECAVTFGPTFQRHPHFP